MDKQNTNTPPPWSEAPPWANYRAQDADGRWGFYKDKPYANIKSNMWSNKKVLFDSSNFYTSIKAKPNPSWCSTLEKRPDDE